MTEFEKGYWNLKELEIQEWMDIKAKGFMKEDVREFIKRLKKGIREDVTGKDNGSNHLTGKIMETINKIAGFNN